MRRWLVPSILTLAGAVAACRAGAKSPERTASSNVGLSTARGAASPSTARAQLGEPSSVVTPTAELATTPAEQSARFDDSQIDWDGNAVLRTLGKIDASLTWSEYSYGLSVNEKQGVYKFDCSGMVYWVLKRAAPRAAYWSAAGLDRRPLARDFQRRIARVAPGERKGGWQRIARVSDLQPGDVVAWLKPPQIRSPNTGHVAFVLLPPQALPGYSNAFLVRIADSTRLLHDEDTRSDRDGFGFGTILLLTDVDSGEPTGFGWVADKWGAFKTEISLGRPEQ